MFKKVSQRGDGRWEKVSWAGREGGGEQDEKGCAVGVYRDLA